MNDKNMDPDLKRMLDEWAAPEPGASLPARLLSIPGRYGQIPPALPSVRWAVAASFFLFFSGVLLGNMTLTLTGEESESPFYLETMGDDLWSV